MKWLCGQVFAILCVLYAPLLLAQSGNEKSSNVQDYVGTERTRWSIGIVGGGIVNIGSTAPFGIALASVRGIEPFPVPLRMQTALNGFSAGLEAEYRLNAGVHTDANSDANISWSLALRGEYTRQETTLTGNEAVVISLWDGAQRRFVPVRTTLLNTLTLSPQTIALTPLLRLRVGSVLTLGVGARLEAIVRNPLDYSITLASLPPNTLVAFDSTGGQSLALPLELAPQARRELSISPIVSLGTTWLGAGVRIMPEIVWQPLLQPFLGSVSQNVGGGNTGGTASTGGEWSLGSVRFNVALMLDMLPARTTTAPADNALPRVDSSNNTKAVVIITQPVISTTVPIFLVPTDSQPRNGAVHLDKARIDNDSLRKDTVTVRDTTIAFVAWNIADTVRLVRRTVTANAGSDTSANAQANAPENVQANTSPNATLSAKFLTITESYIRDIPQPKPYLVASLDTRFIPALGSSRSSETKHISRLQERTFIVRRLDNTGSVRGDNFDTLRSVRFPVMRFLPSVSSELGIARCFLTIAAKKHTSQTPDFLRVVEVLRSDDGRTPIDWDAQLAVVAAKQDSTRLSSDHELLAWLTVQDIEGQERVSDTLRITFDDVSNDVQTADSVTKASIASTIRFVGAIKRAVMWTQAKVPPVTDINTHKAVMKRLVTLLRTKSGSTVKHCIVVRGGDLSYDAPVVVKALRTAVPTAHVSLLTRYSEKESYLQVYIEEE
jgi:hypothetical protein